MNRITGSLEATTHVAIGIGETDRTIAQVWPVFAPRARRVAARLTRSRDLREDLVQEALIAIWQIDPTRFDLRIPREMRYLRRLMINRMLRAWYAEHQRTAFQRQITEGAA